MNLELNSDFDETIIERSLDKMLDFIKEQKLDEKHKHPDYVYFDERLDEWIKIDVEKELQERVREEHVLFYIKY